MAIPTNPSIPEPRRFSIHLPRPLWIAVVTIVLACAAVAILALGARYSILFRSFGEVNLELTELSGKEASHRLERVWPAGLDPAEVQKVSHKYASTKDSHSTW